MSSKNSPSVRSGGDDAKSSLGQALQQFRNAFIGVGVFSALINLLALTGSLFMLQVYDRVLPSKSVPTLIGLAFIVLGLYTFQAVLELIRSRVMVRIGSAFDASLTEKGLRFGSQTPAQGAARAGRTSANPGPRRHSLVPHESQDR